MQRMNGETICGYMRHITHSLEDGCFQAYLPAFLTENDPAYCTMRCEESNPAATGAYYRSAV